MWIDQEAEWQSTVDQVKYHMYHPDVEPYWFQIPIRLFNATSRIDHWLHCWDPEKKDLWVHPQDPISKKENIYGTDRFEPLYEAILKKEFPEIPTALVGGVRCEESPRRRLSMTTVVQYKWITWAKRYKKATIHKEDHFTVYPIYDWSYTDVWKAIHENNWRYNKLYDYQYQYGIPLPDMRVSNVHHETAVKALFYMQEVEPAVWERLTRRIAGVDMASKFGWDDFAVRELPFMFADWKEYRDYLLENLIDNEYWKDRFRARFKSQERLYGDHLEDKFYKVDVQSILTNDWEGIKARNYGASPTVRTAYVKRKKELIDAMQRSRQ